MILLDRFTVLEKMLYMLSGEKTIRDEQEVAYGNDDQKSYLISYKWL